MATKSGTGVVKCYCPSSTVALFSGGGVESTPPGHRKPKKPSLNKVKRYLKCVFELRPSLPKYQFTWDVGIVVKFMAEMDTSTLKTLLLKLQLYWPFFVGKELQRFCLLWTPVISSYQMNYVLFESDIC